MRKVFLLFLLAVLLSGSGLIALNAPAKAETDAPLDTPVTLVGSGVTSYALAAPKLFWHTGIPQCPPALQGENADSANAQAPDEIETIQRIATYGSDKRALYSQSQNCNQGKILSNIVVDADYIYWIGPQGLMQLSTNANPGDPAQLVNAFVQSPGELAVASDRIYAIYNNSGGSNTKVGYVWKNNHQLVTLATPGNYAGNIQTDDKYVYFLVGTTLRRIDPNTASNVALTTSVTGYYPEGSRLIFCSINPFQCFYSDNVYVAKSASIYIYNNNTSSLGSAIYTSVDSTASVRELVTDFSRLFFIESRQTNCSPFCSYTDIILRSTRSGGSPVGIYTYGPNFSSGVIHLTSDGTYIFWQEAGMLQRMAGDASALPSINMKVTGIEVTQGIQDTGNSVLLVKNRRTFVRVYVKSDGAAVSGVTALLTKRGDPFTLSPVNQSGTKITVRNSPNRTDLEQSFLFELPWSWTTGSSLTMDFTLNPYKVPLEPNYADNTTSATVSFNNSPNLSVEFFRLNYKIGGTTYKPRITQDVLATYSWIMRAYPLGGAVGQNFKPRLWDVDGGTTLGKWVNRTDPDCYDVYDDPDDDVGLCASYFTNGWLFYYRVATMMGQLNVGLKTNAFYYGMISDASNNFPRGQAIYDKTSVGPTGIPGSPFSLGSGWDTDGTYADWYAAHEIGHSLGRAHPNAGSDDPATKNTAENCRHSRSDPGYPYGNTSSSAAPIGPASGIMEGFDFGDPAFGIARAIYPSSQWNDMMSYCVRQWISDYTYEGIYSYMIGHPSLEAEMPANVAVNGDFLMAAGSIKSDGSAANFALLRRLSSVVNVPPITPGAYTLRLLDAGSNVLADYAFTPDTSDDANVLTFGQVVNFVAGTRTIQVIKTSGGQVLVSVPVSANAPTISNVALQGAPNPVSGVVTLGWTASDPDGDLLTFDIAYSRDNGVTFEPVAVNVTGSSTQVDTASLGGSGTAILRVTASDGVNLAFADSAPFTMANKPPQPFILTPGAETHIHWGQLVNFSGLAIDAQDGTVADAGLSWQDTGGNVLGTGPLFSTTNLPVGVNVISLVATNSVGVSASAAVTVTVDDDLNLPGPTLSAGPGLVGWQVENGSTTLQTANIVINNSGSGNLDWTASENVAWLSLSATSGTLNAADDSTTITVTADPTGLAGDQTYATDITLNNAADPTQTITIHVTLSLGDVHTVINSPVIQTLYLPIIIR
jgi:hypothetical protein